MGIKTSSTAARVRVGICSFLMVPLLVALVSIPILKTIQKGHPLKYVYANLLLFTPFRQQAMETWPKVLELGAEIIPRHKIAEMNAADFTMDSLDKLSNHFRDPVLIRGLFSDTPALTLWEKPGYLREKLGDLYVPVVNDAGYSSTQEDRTAMYFRDAAEEIMNNANSTKYLFFPVKSRFHSNFSAVQTEESIERINQLVLDDLHIDSKIFRGFGTESHKTYAGAQLIIGQGHADSEKSTGTGWHCAPGNNWFVQVTGRKRWYFIDPAYSPYLHPLRGGTVNMATGTANMSYYEQFIPVGYGDVEAGDVLYNPDWQWHTIVNYEGLSIGVPMREFNVSLSVQNNAQFTSIVGINVLLDKFGLSIGGYA